MADIFYDEGKILALNGIKAQVDSIKLLTSAGTIISSTSVTGSTLFSVSATTAVMTNDSAISFTIEAGDVGDTAAAISLVDGSDTLIRVDLDSSVLLTTAGTATIAAEALEIEL